MPSPLNSRPGGRLIHRSRNQDSPHPPRPAVKSGGNPSDSVVLSPQARGLANITEQDESARLKANGNRGHLVQLAQGSKPGNIVTIHGINASPDSVKALSEASAKQGRDVHTFLYDDRKSRLGKTSSELASELSRISAGGEPLTIRAHSMGGRLSVDALRKLQAQGKLPKQVRLEMVNPVLGGTAGANSARLAPGFVGPLIPGVEPGKDMGTDSEFQKTLETTQLPPSVRTTTYIGTRDHLVSAEDPRFQAVHDGLNGRLRKVINGDHDSSIGTVADTIR